MPQIFICYRRDDSAPYAGRLYDNLTAQYGHAMVFQDVDSVEVAADFVEAIRVAVRESSVLVVVIGPHWLDARDASGQRRLESEGDYVRLEIWQALARDIVLVPVLVDGATMPRPQDLPMPLKGLANRQALELRNTSWHRDVEQLTKVLGNVPGLASNAGSATPSREVARQNAGRDPQTQQTRTPQIFSPVWYRPDDHFGASLLAMHDSGTLLVAEDSLEFRGKNTTLSITQINRVTCGKIGRDFINNWVKVEYGPASTAFFLDGGMLGYRGLLGGTARILAALQALVRVNDGAERERR